MSSNNHQFGTPPGDVLPWLCPCWATAALVRPAASATIALGALRVLAAPLPLAAVTSTRIRW